jgi:protocatechuate 3,4-dioxygenase beta subunit
MEPRITRAQALAAAGAAGLSALLAACGGGNDEGAVATDADTVGTTAGANPPGAESSTDAALFDGAPACMITPEQTEGPFYLEVDAIRSDIRDDRQGTPLRLLVRVQDTDGCSAVSNVVVELWHCDAEGAYSGVQGDDARYLRGAQVTDADGIARFTTIYPGWYPGRTVHIHAKVHLDAGQELTTQLYFDDDVTTAAYADAPYDARPGRDTFNDSDGIYASGGGGAALLTPTRDGDGWLGLVTLGIAAA